jgi:cytochrome b5
MTKKLFLLLLLIFGVSQFYFTKKINGATEYTQTEVSQHNTSTDCWMTFDGNVYDFTSTLDWHKAFIDITPWCGDDMTTDFKNKGGEGKDHKRSTYTLLTDYFLGTFLIQGRVVEESIEIPEKEVISQGNTEEIVIQATPDKTEISQNKYNMIIPVGLCSLLYIFFYFLSGTKTFRGHKYLSRKTFNLFWNTVLLLSLIPSFGFGVFMVIRTQHPELHEVDFNFIYWHVEFSLVLGTLALLHLIQRLKQYLMPWKSLLRKRG